MKENKRFNRCEGNFENLYYHNYGWAQKQTFRKTGWIKCKLLHGYGFSLIIPDQIYIEKNGLKWIQPLAFLPVQLVKHNEEFIEAILFVDISCGNNLKVIFTNKDFEKSYLDGSQLFKCQIFGPKKLHEYATGDAEWSDDHLPYISIFHHTSIDAKEKIIQSGYFVPSSYNIQGTIKKLINVSYAYFTPLDSLRTNEDLVRIAMAEKGIIELRRDGFIPPLILEPGWESKYKNDILRLEVYSCNPNKREAALKVWIDASILAPQHIYMHDENGIVYYEFPHPFIHRIGTLPKNIIIFDDKKKLHRQINLKSFDYVVVGDCTTLEGLKAPYDEEDTQNIMKLEQIKDNLTILDFWFNFGNKDHYTSKNTEYQKFTNVSSST